MNNGGKYDKMKKDILEIGTFVDAIRLPVGLFANTQIGTDIVIFRKK
jgi:type I restriction-modification system DNA methylase subunit